MRILWVSCIKMTGIVDVRADDIIVRASPIFKKFIGQPIDNLRNWLSTFGDYREENINDYS